MFPVRPVLLPLAALALTACAESSPGLDPPGLDGDAPRLFFPLGMDVSKDGTTLYVASSNFDRAYNGGTLVGFPVTGLSTAGPAADASGQPVFAADNLPAGTTVARVDTFASELRVNPAGDALYVTTRDQSTLTKVPLAAGGGFSCPDVSLGCSAGAVLLGKLSLTDPFALEFATLAVPTGGAAAAPEPVVLVSHFSPESTGTGATAANARLAVIPERLATQEAKPFESGAYTVDLGAPGSDSLVFDPLDRRLFIGGCFLRVSATQVVPCASDQDSSTFFTANPLRSVQIEAGAGASVQQQNLGTVTGGGDTVAVDLSSDGAFLYVLTSRPSALLTLVKPTGAGGPPLLKSIVPLANTPSRMRVLRRKAGDAAGDVVVVTAQLANAFLVVDPLRGQLLAQLSTVVTATQGGVTKQVGKGPYGLASKAGAASDTVFVGLFSDCGLEAIDVPFERPFDAKVVGVLRNLAGSCP